MNVWEILKVLFWISVVAGTVFYFTKSVKRLFQVAGGLALFETYNNLFDIGLWPIIQAWFGGIGVLVLTVDALIFNFLMLKWYQKRNVDWLGITVTDEIVKKSSAIMTEYVLSSGLKRLKLALPAFGLWIAKQAIIIPIIPFIVLSVCQDSFVATAFSLYRKNGSVSTALKREDYFIFVLSTVFGCLAWTLFSEWVTIPAFKNVWHVFLLSRV